MDWTDHSTIRDQADQRIGRQQAEADDNSFLQGLQVVLVETGIDHEQKDRGDLSGSRERVLDGGVLGKELGRQVGGGNILVVWREGISLQTERTNPELASHVDRAGTCGSVDPSVIRQRTWHLASID